MLARTADNLYWLARYMERADYLARIVNVTRRLSALPVAYGVRGTEWESALESAGAFEPYSEKYGEPTAENAIEFLCFDKDNPSSIVNCIEAGRNNGRAVRTALTVETWEAINSGWQQLKSMQAGRGGLEDAEGDHLSAYLDAVMKLAMDVDGSAYRTMLRNDGYWFKRLGLYVERADNTARLLDVKYNLLLPDTEQVGGPVDYFQWTAILRAVSALTSYHWIYRSGVKPGLVVDLLVLRPEMPRSLIACYGEIVRFLDAIAKAYGRQGAAQERAREVLTRLEKASIETIFDVGLHEFITAFVEDNGELGSVIGEQYLVT